MFKASHITYRLLISLIVCVGFVFMLSNGYQAHAASTPGGVWVNPTTDNNVYEPGLTYTIQARAYGNGSPVSKVNFTLETGGNWYIMCSPTSPDAGTTDRYSCTTDFRPQGVYIGGTFQLSFDVYAQDGGKNFAPNGVRTEQMKTSYYGGTWNSPADGSTYHVNDHIRMSANAYPQNGGYPIVDVRFLANFGGSWNKVCDQTVPNGHEFGCDWYPGSNAIGNTPIRFDIYYANNSYTAVNAGGNRTLHIQSNNTHPQLSWVSPLDHFTMMPGNNLQLRAAVASLSDQLQISSVDFRAWWPGNPNNVAWSEICTVNNLNYPNMYGCDWNMYGVPAGTLQVRFDVKYTDGTVQTYEGPTHEGHVPQTIPFSSGNWAGYIVTSQDGVNPGTFNVATATWIVPSVSCNGGTGQQGIWVGIGGYVNSGNLKQTGTVGICTNGQVSYRGFWQMPSAKNSSQDNYGNPYYYDPSVLPVSAGDRVTAAVQYLGNNKYLLQLDVIHNNVTYEQKHWTDVSDAPQSAEWIVEPKDSGFLPNFANVTLTKCSANGVNLGNFPVVTEAQSSKITVNGVQNNATDFTLNWQGY